jgi:hypothetical protein
VSLRLLAAAVAITVAGTALPAAATAPSSAPAKARISVSVTQPAVVVGQRTAVKGRISPAKATTRVMLQQKVSGGWKSLAQQRVGRSGSYRFGVAPRSGGTFRYRVIRLPWRPGVAVSSRTVTITAYRWIDVTTTASHWVEWDGVTAYGEPAAIDGSTYPGSITIDATAGGPRQGGYVQLDLGGHRCAAFEATVGGLDTNAVGSRIDTELRFDGGLLREDSYGVGDSEHLVLDVRDVTLLRLTASVADDELEAYLGIGSPRLLCAT